MGKIIPLLVANLKSFMRNWKTLLLLLGIPLILITIIFLSFSSSGLQNINVGIVESSGNFSLKPYIDSYFSFMNPLEYATQDSCLDALRNYKEYVCIVVTQDGRNVKMNVWYDNTHDVIIWAILQRIKYGTDALQQERSKQVAGAFITTAQQTDAQLQQLRQGLTDANSQIGSYITQIDTASQNLKQNRNDLSSTLNQMDSDISGARQTSTQMQTDKDNFYSAANTGLMTTHNILDNAQNVSEQSRPAFIAANNELNYMGNQLYSYNQQAQNNINDFNFKINQYQQASNKGHQELVQMDNANNQLQNTKYSLQSYQGRISNTNQQMAQVHQSLQNLATMSPEDVANPVRLENDPTYTSRYKSNAQDLTQEQINRGTNLVSYQTIFPKILLLIILFFSMIISSFISLNTINSESHERVKLVKGYFFADFISIFAASLIVTIMSLVVVVTLGNLLFQLPLLENIIPVGIIIILLTAVFSLLGMIIAFLIRNESITMMVITFTLVFLMFISGFLLSPERMSPLSEAIAYSSPGMLGLSAFNRVVFYSRPMGDIAMNIYSLLVWLMVLLALVLLTKNARRI